MKHRTHLLLCSGILLVLAAVFFNWMNIQTAAPVPQPSVPGGYYDSAFTLMLHAPSNGAIYYTTDGSTPSIGSSRYEDGIPISDRTPEPNVCNSVQNVIPDWKTYTPDPTPVPKGTVVRAIYINDFGIQSDVMTQTYFVGLEQPERGLTLSLAFEHEDLFGENGIYVTGKEYDSWYLAGGPEEATPVPNFQKDLEVPVTLELMDGSGDILNQAAGVRLQGASARAERVKRLTLVSRIEYSGNAYFDIPLYGNVLTHSVMIKSYLPDAMAADLLSDRAASVQKSIPVRVYLNGEYLYDSYMLERYDSHYFRQYYQVDDRVMIKNGVPDDDTLLNPERSNYGDFMYWIQNTDFSDPAQWEQIQKEISVQSYIDFMIANYFFCNIDFNDIHNHVLWRSPILDDTPYSDMRWRWCVYDVDALVWIPNKASRGKPETINVFQNDVRMDMHDTSLFPALSRNPEFRQQFVLSFLDVLNNNFAPEKVETVLRKHGQTLDWQDGYFLKRPDYALQHLAEEFSLTGTVETVTVTNTAPEAGSVTVNTSRIDLTRGSWTGRYFTDYPITITAEPADGYRFLGWKGDSDSSSATITLPVDGGVRVEPLFEKIS